MPTTVLSNGSTNACLGMDSSEMYRSPEDRAAADPRRIVTGGAARLVPSMGSPPSSGSMPSTGTRTIAPRFEYADSAS